MFFYKNKDLKRENYKTKLNLMIDLFKNVKNTTYLNNNFIITIPIMKTNYNYCYNETTLLNYDVYGIQAINLMENSPLGIIKIENNIGHSYTLHAFWLH